MYFVIAWMGGKYQRGARPHQPTPPWRGPRKRVANSQRSFERAMEAKAGTPEGRWRKGAYGRISQRVVW